jgi:hypothetical protein
MQFGNVTAVESLQAASRAACSTAGLRLEEDGSVRVTIAQYLVASDGKRDACRL